MGTDNYVIFAMGTIMFKTPVLVKSLPLLWHYKVGFLFYRELDMKAAQCCMSV